MDWYKFSSSYLFIDTQTESTLRKGIDRRWAIEVMRRFTMTLNKMID